MVLLFLDGSLSVDGVALLEDYADRPGFRGKPNFDYERLEKLEFFKEHERIPLPAAIAAYTINGAYLMHNEEESGSIKVGKFADFVVLDKNMFDVPVHVIHKINVDMTIFGGELVYERK